MKADSDSAKVGPVEPETASSTAGDLLLEEVIAIGFGKYRGTGQLSLIHLLTAAPILTEWYLIPKFGYAIGGFPGLLAGIFFAIPVSFLTGLLCSKLLSIGAWLAIRFLERFPAAPGLDPEMVDCIVMGETIHFLHTSLISIAFCIPVWYGGIHWATLGVFLGELIGFPFAFLIGGLTHFLIVWVAFRIGGNIARAMVWMSWSAELNHLMHRQTEGNLEVADVAAHESTESPSRRPEDG